MSTGFAIKPELSPNFPDFPKIWKCPITGLKVPKEFDANLSWRADLLAKADEDHGLRTELINACSASTLFYINTFCMTFRQKDVNPLTGKEEPCKNPHVPFITWPIQDLAVTSFEEGIELGEDRAADKSRDMGATWLCLAVIDHKFLFRDDFLTLMLSRTEAYVDDSGNPKSLFWKLDYIHEWLPDWMRPPACMPGQKNRTKMHLKNEWTNSIIDGESTTINAARGDRRTLVFMDEFGAVQNGQAMRSATADVTPCRIINSTPKAGSEYSKWIMSGKIKIVKLPWYEHPGKGAGRYVIQDEMTQKYLIKSPWRVLEDARRSPAEIAEEVDMNHMGSGSMFFEANVVEQHKALYGCPAKHTRKIRFSEEVPQARISRFIQQRQIEVIKASPSTSGKELRIWAELTNGRLDQSKTYNLGIDVSKGQGASNSVISISCDQTEEKVAEWADAGVPPYELAPIVAALCIWVGGANPRRLPRVAWEANGPGWDFGKVFAKDFSYPFCYYNNSSDKQHRDRSGDNYGWHSTRQRKEELLSAYRRYLALGGYINHSIESLDEAMTYLYYDSGTIGPAGLMEESEGARATHGDRVMADALTCLFKNKTVILTHAGSVPPRNSVGYRKREAFRRRKEQKKKAGRTFDFRPEKVLRG